MKIVTVVGARPQFVKAAVLSRAFNESGYPIDEIIVHTGQHFNKEMSDIFFDEMEIPHPTYNLNIHGLSHGAMTGQMLEGIERILKEELPDYVLVYGDTNSTLAGSLAAKKINIPVIHIEAGLRSFNMRMPEEINRILTDRISDVLFCPTERAMKNLAAEGFEQFSCRIVNVGDVMQDAALYYKEKSDKMSSIVSDLNLSENNFALATIHRAENTDEYKKLASIVEALNELHREIRVIIPLHPRTRALILRMGIEIRFEILNPVGYFDMLQLISGAKMILTDSGGLQKEAYFFQKYCITLREETEWTELVDFGYNRLVGSDKNAILSAANELIGHSNDFFEQGLYGGGSAAQNIINELIKLK